MRDIDAEALKISEGQFFKDLTDTLEGSPFFMTAMASFDRPARRRMGRRLGKQLTTMPTFGISKRPVMGQDADGNDLYIPNRADRRAAGYRDPVDFG